MFCVLCADYLPIVFLFQTDGSSAWVVDGEINDPQPGAFLYVIKDTGGDFTIQVFPVYEVDDRNYNGLPNEPKRLPGAYVCAGYTVD